MSSLPSPETAGAPFVPPTALAMLEWRVAHDPDAAFTINLDGTACTYGETAKRISLLRLALSAAGVRRGDFVGLHLTSEPGWIVAMFACWQLGAIPALCNALAPAAEAARRFRRVNVRLVVSNGSDPAAAEHRLTISGDGLPDTATVEDPAWVPGAPQLRREDIGTILFTSGTTGEPKPIPRLQSQIADAPRMTAGAYAKTADFRPRTAPARLSPAILFNPFGHSASLGRMVFAMYVGRPLLVVPKFDAGSLALVASRYPIDALQLTPAMVHTLAHTELDIRFQGLKYATCGTAPLPAATRDRFEARYGVPILQAYGSTEGVITTLERYEDVMAGRRGPGSVGRLASSTPYRIVDAGGNDVKPGEKGELLGKLTNVQDAFPHPSVDKDGWFHTGDVVHIDEHGILYITGRLKEMMIVGGFNVYPGEVEEVLVRAPQVHNVVVVSLPDERLGEIPVAGLVWENGVPPAARDAAWREIAQDARRFLEPYKIPRRWFGLEDIPRNPNGKVDRRAATALATAALK